MNFPAFLGGIGIWSFLEYVSHRFLLRGPLRGFHLRHHKQPTGYGFDWKPSIVAGVLAGFVVYSHLHAKLHHGARIGRLKDQHDLHHQRPNRNFGVTSSLWDRIFQTFDNGSAEPHFGLGDL